MDTQIKQDELHFLLENCAEENAEKKARDEYERDAPARIKKIKAAHAALVEKMKSEGRHELFVTFNCSFWKITIGEIVPLETMEAFPEEIPF